MALLILASAILACSKATPEEIRHYTLTPTSLPVSTDTGTPVPFSTSAKATAIPSDTASPTLSAQVIVIQSLNVRQAAGTDQPGIGILKSGDIVILTGDCLDGWAEIEWKESTAWVNADYLSGGFCK